MSAAQAVTAEACARATIIGGCRETVDEFGSPRFGLGMLFSDARRNDRLPSSPPDMMSVVRS